MFWTFLKDNLTSFNSNGYLNETAWKVKRENPCKYLKHNKGPQHCVSVRSHKPKRLGTTGLIFNSVVYSKSFSYVVLIWDLNLTDNY